MQSDSEPGQPARCSTAPAAAGAPTIRLAAVSTPSTWAISTARFTSSARPKSSAVTIQSKRRGRPPLARETHELRALAQAPLRHLGAQNHQAGLSIEGFPKAGHLVRNARWGTAILALSRMARTDQSV